MGMSTTANKTMIGAFVIGAIGLAIIAVVIFGSGKFLTEKQDFEMYFEGSVQGLDVGSPVLFHGVKIGSVTNIALTFDPRQLVFYIPVIVEIERDKMIWLGAPPKKSYELLRPLIDKGLRAQLQTTSFVTGQVAVAIDFFPDKPAKYVGISKKYPEVPTVPSTMAQITKTIQELPIRELFGKLDSSITAINALVSSDEAQASVKSLKRALEQATTTMKTINTRIGPFVANLQNTSGSINEVAAKVNKSLSGEKGVPAHSRRHSKLPGRRWPRPSIPWPRCRPWRRRTRPWDTNWAMPFRR